MVDDLASVQSLRAAQAAEPGQAARVALLKTYQARRFSNTYADLLSSKRYAQAAQFFLTDLYGPHDFADRDAQFMRMLPAVHRVFPADLVATIGLLADLHARTEALDDACARALPPQVLTQGLTPAGYLNVWQSCSRPPEREHQIEATLKIGQALDRATRSLTLRTTLRLMAGPARAAGLGALHQFLQRGFDAFVAMKGAQEFLELIAARERALAEALFQTHAATIRPPLQGPLAALPQN